MKTRIALALCIVLCAGGAAGARQGNPLEAARDLYASARYDEALSMLDGLTMGAEPVNRRAVEQYRSLCLLALGRTTEAENAIGAVVTADPMFVPGESEASPRVRAAFSDVRQRLLPGIATARYTSAKAAFDARDYAGASVGFRELLALLTDPQMGNRLPDLRVLAAGFLDLSVAAAAPPAAKAEPPAAAPAPVPQAPPPPDPRRVWTADEAGVTAPVPVKQEIPRMPAAASSQVRTGGLLELIIDEQGRVVSITLRSSIHPIYDPLLVAAARQWRYTPAHVAGVAVKFRKLVQVTVSPRS